MLLPEPVHAPDALLEDGVQPDNAAIIGHSIARVAPDLPRGDAREVIDADGGELDLGYVGSIRHVDVNGADYQKLNVEVTPGGE